MASRHLALVGPTASGKSALGLAAARELGDIEIVSVDSMQVYRGMDIGTAKPSPAERAQVPHHCLDLADPGDEWSVVRFRDAVRVAVADIERRGRRALLLGGTGLYFRAVIDPLDFPGEDRELRAEVEAAGDTAALYAELVRVDPVAAARIDRGNRRRVVRALEVVRLTGRAFSSFGPGLEEYGETVFSVRIVGLRWPRPVLRARIAARLTGMRSEGLLEEVRVLLPRGLSRTARQAIGYAELIDHLEGRCTLDEAFALAEQRTWRFARRQLKWFERDPRVHWLDLEDGEPVEQVEKSEESLSTLLEAWSACPASA